MHQNQIQDQNKSTELSIDQQRYNKVVNYVHNYHNYYKQELSLFKDVKLAKKRLANLRHHIINDLDKYLVEFESNFIHHGGQLIWAQDAKHAIDEILKLVNTYGLKEVVQGSGELFEELDLVRVLQKNGLECTDIETSNFVASKIGHTKAQSNYPLHPLNMQDIAQVMHERYQTPESLNASQLSYFVNHQNKAKLSTAQLCIVQANALISRQGSIAISSNDAAIIKAFQKSPIRLVLAEIDDILPELKDFALYENMLALTKGAQQIRSFSSILNISGISNPSHQRTIVVLVDNGRSKILEKTEMRSAMWCINCGACQLNCPVYHHVGGNTDEQAFPGPIKAVKLPHLMGFENFGHLSYQCSLCGKCADHCPADIDLPRLLLENRAQIHEEGFEDSDLKSLMKQFNRNILKRKRLDRMNGGIKNVYIKMLLKKKWGEKKVFPKTASKSFNQQYLNK